MSFQAPISVKDILDGIRHKEYLPPAIQREFVWDSDQIRRLVDSLMRGYPIGSFLVWKVEPTTAKDYVFYDFLTDYHTLHNPYATKAVVPSDRSVLAILDGQQRPLNLPRRVDGPASAAQLAADLLRNRREEITLAVYLDEQHRLIGHAVIAVGWVQAARLSARPILQGSQACRASSVILVRYGRSRSLAATQAEHRVFGVLAAACIRAGLPVLDHLVVTEGRGFTSTFRR